MDVDLCVWKVVEPAGVVEMQMRHHDVAHVVDLSLRGLLLPRACRFTPTCSEYALEAVVKYGFWRGGGRALGRLLRCHPFHPGGVDLP